MKTTEEALKRYRDITVEIIDDVKRGDYEKVQPLFSSREMVLQKLKDADFDREDLRMALKQERILEIDNELREVIEGRKKQLALKMNSSANANKAAMNYSKGKKNIDINILNEKM